MRLTPCGCELRQYDRVQRAFWMRLFRYRRLYQCSGCGQLLFLRKIEAQIIDPRLAV